MLEMILKPLRKITLVGDRSKKINGFYRVRIVNRSGQVIWIAKNTLGDLHDILQPGHSLEIRLPSGHKMEFYAYKATNGMNLTGLDYHAKKEFTTDDVWVIY